VLFYRTDIAKKAGMTDPPKTWDELKAMARAMKEKGGAKYGIGLSTNNWQEYLPFIWQNGGEVVSADRKTALLTEPRAREAIEFFADFYRAYRMSPPQQTARWTWDDDGLVMNDRLSIAMTYVVLTSATRVYPRFGLTALPKGRQRASALGVTATLSIANQARDAAGAASVLIALADRVTRYVPPAARRQSAAELQALFPTLTPNGAQTILDSLEVSRALVLDDQQRTRRLHATLYDALRAPIQSGTRPVAGIVEDANRRVQELLDQR
jgi:hypothetical protein